MATVVQVFKNLNAIAAQEWRSQGCDNPVLNTMLPLTQMQQKVVVKTSLDPVCSQNVQVIAVGQAQQLAISVSRARKKPSCSHCNCKWTCPSSLVECRLQTEFMVKNHIFNNSSFGQNTVRKRSYKLWQAVCFEKQ